MKDSDKYALYLKNPKPPPPKLSFTRQIKKILLRPTTIAILLGIFSAVVIRQFPNVLQQLIVEDIVTPLLSALFGLIIAINVPMIFISVMASICTSENMAVLKELGTKVFVRFAKIILLIVVITFSVNIFFFDVLAFNLEGDFLSEDFHEVKEILGLLLGIIPQNIIEPFVTPKILQVLVLAAMAGIGISILGEKGAALKNMVLNFKTLIFKMVALVMKVIPLVMFLCLLKIGVTHSLDELLEAWRILAAIFSSYIILMFVMLIRIKIKHNYSILDFLKKIYPAYEISFMTGSGSAAIPKNLEVLHSELKIKESLCYFYIPLSHSFCPTTMLIAMITHTFFAAEFSGMQISLFQLLVVAFLSVQFAISAVKENGGMLAMLTLLITQLGLSMDALGMIMTADMFVMNISGVVGLIVRDSDLLDLSYHLNEIENIPV